MLQAFTDTIIVTGHYGSGKTNLSLNIALDLKKQGRNVVLADLDVVNPYFRTADFRDTAKENDIELLASDYANSNLDIPSLNSGLEGKLGGEATLIIDVGGDDAGAFALGRYAARIKERPYTMLYVVNSFRYLIRDPAESALLLEQIETASRLKATHIVNNSNLSTETTIEDVRGSIAYAESVARLTGLPLAFTAARTELAAQLPQGMYPVQTYVNTPWNKA